jgi:hypothetical protein
MNFLQLFEVAAIYEFEIKTESTKPTRLILPTEADWWDYLHVTCHAALTVVKLLAWQGSWWPAGRW